MRRRTTGGLLAAAVVAVLVMVVPAYAQQGRRLSALAQDPACTTPKPASAGGPLPKDANTVVLRWLGVSNYEIGRAHV